MQPTIIFISIKNILINNNFYIFYFPPKKLESNLIFENIEKEEPTDNKKTHGLN